jgi:hypothetical protein
VYEPPVCAFSAVADSPFASVLDAQLTVAKTPAAAKIENKIVFIVKFKMLDKPTESVYIQL